MLKLHICNTPFSQMSQKMKANFYLDYPKHSYYEISINPDKDSPASIITTLFHRLYPLHLHSYSTSSPAFIHVREGTTLDPDKTFAENGICKRNAFCSYSRSKRPCNLLPRMNSPKQNRQLHRQQFLIFLYPYL